LFVLGDSRSASRPPSTVVYPSSSNAMNLRVRSGIQHKTCRRHDMRLDEWVLIAGPLSAEKRPAQTPASILVIGNSDERVVVLAAALVHQEIIIAAAAVARIFAAGARASVIDRAAALFRIEELADAPVMLVALAAHQIFVAVTFARVALLRRIERDLEIFREAFHVALIERDHRI